MNVTHRAEDWIGRTAVRHLRVSADMIDQFASLSGDRSPIHMADASAQQRGFQARVVHGMLLAALVSAIIGMELPGESGVLQDMQFAFPKAMPSGRRNHDSGPGFRILRIGPNTDSQGENHQSRRCHFGHGPGQIRFETTRGLAGLRVKRMTFAFDGGNSRTVSDWSGSGK